MSAKPTPTPRHVFHEEGVIEIQDANGLRQRQRFEAWADDQGYPLKKLETSDEYLDLRTQGAWEAYQRGVADGVKGDASG